MLDKSAMGQPGWLHPWFELWTGLPRQEAMTMAYGAAGTETLIAIALITGFARKSLYLLGGVYSLLLWATGEGFGGPYQSGSTDIGAAIIYVFVFAALLVAARSGPDPYSVDFYLEQRIPWWDRVAEVSHHRR
jgi:nitrite reductase (NO-forming)